MSNSAAGLEVGPEPVDPSYRSLLDGAPFLAWLTGPDGLCTFFNHPWLVFRGRSPGEELGEGWLEGVHPDDRERCLDIHRTALRTRQSFRMEVRLRRADGVWRWILGEGTARFDSTGAFLGHVAVCVDIDGQRAAESALSRLTDSHSLILASAGEGILGLDGHGRHTFVNPAAERLLGWSSAELVGRESHPMWHHARPDGSPYQVEECPILGSIRDGEVHRVGHEVFWRRDGSSFLVEYVSTPIHDGAAITGAVVVFRDLTEIARLEAVAAAVESTNSIGWILSAIRHEIGNPVNSVKTALGVLAENLDRFPPEKIRSYVDRSLAELVRVEELLATLKGYNLFERVRVAPFELTGFLMQFGRVVRDDFFQRGIGVVIDVPDVPTLALADPRAIRQVLVNLLANSAEALQGCPDPRIVLSVIRGADHILLRVEDNGRGIPPDVMQHLFEPFRTTKEGGTGLGLVISRKTLARMDADISVESEAGRGTAVTLRFRSANYSGNVSP